ncbi:MAG: YtxH domain-containing protein [Lacibacter sp.]|jgi:gas vesicle protein
MKKGYLVGLGVAMATGAAAGMLMAPEKGKDLRKKMMEKGSKFSEKCKNALKRNRKEKPE